MNIRYEFAVLKDFNLKALWGFEKANKKTLQEKSLIFTDNPHIQSLASLKLLNRQYEKIEFHPELAESNKVDLLFFKMNHLDDQGLGTCFYCKKKFNEFELNFDHYIPYYLGGQNVSSNLKISCKCCNELKGSIHPHDMPFSWALFLNNVKEKKYKTSLLLLRALEKSNIYKEISQLEKTLVSKIISKEIAWRKTFVSK